jgi:hypothetical protein
MEFDINVLKNINEVAINEQLNPIIQNPAINNPVYNPSSPSHQLAQFLQTIQNFISPSNGSTRFGIIVRGSNEEVAALSNALLNKKILIKKISMGLVNRDEIDYLNQQIDLHANKFRELTGISLPF